MLSKYYVFREAKQPIIWNIVTCSFVVLCSYQVNSRVDMESEDNT